MKFKTMLMLILILILAIMPVSDLIAQESNPPMLFVGGNYDEAPTVIYGLGLNLGGNLWSLAKFEVGKYSEVDLKVAYLISLREDIKMGPIAGPNIEWQLPEGSEDLISYFTGAGGFIWTYELDVDIGFWAAVEYKFDFKPEDESMFVNGYTYSLGFNFPLKL